MEDSIETAFVTEKRLTDSDLDEERGCLTIRAAQFKNALLFFSRNEETELREGKFMPVILVEHNSKGTETIARTSLLLGMLNDDKGYVLAGRWNEIKKRNEEKFQGISGLHAVIQLYCSRPRPDQINFDLIVKEPEMPERLRKHLETMKDVSEAEFLTEKRLTDTDLGQSPVFKCFLSIPEQNVNNANLFTEQETELLNLGQSVPVRLVDVNGSEPVESFLMLEKPAMDYVLNQQWNEVVKRNENKLIGIDGLHAVIQLWFFRNHSSTLCFGLHITEEARTEYAEASISTGDESGSRTSTSTWGYAEASTSDGNGSCVTSMDAGAIANEESG